MNYLTIYGASFKRKNASDICIRKMLYDFRFKGKAEIKKKSRTPC
jgi:hypothetical protein